MVVVEEEGTVREDRKGVRWTRRRRWLWLLLEDGRRRPLGPKDERRFWLARQLIIVGWLILCECVYVFVRVCVCVNRVGTMGQSSGEFEKKKGFSVFQNKSMWVG